MTVLGLRLREQLSSGRDGVRYLATDQQQRSLTVDRLQSLRADPARLRWVTQRVTLVAELDQPGVAPLLQHDMSAPVPYLVSLHYTHTLADVLRGDQNLGCSLGESIRRLAGAVAALHRLGVSHGGLSPSRVLLDEEGCPCLEPFGVSTAPRELTPHDQACQAPESQRYSYAADVYSLAALWRISARALQKELGDGTLRDEDRDLLAQMLEREPSSRPSAAVVYHKLFGAERTGAFAAPAGHSGAASPSQVTSAKAVPGKAAPAKAGQSSPQAATANSGAAYDSFVAGTVIGRFKLKALLGEGGMGRVFHALDGGDGSAVALKLLHPQFAKQQLALQRFYREARLLSQLDNPFIARFVEVNEDRGMHYLAMELVAGEPLDQIIETGGRLSEAKVLAVLADLGRALADVHNLGVVHRDIKPANVLVREGDDRLLAKLCDFGIARQMGAPEEAADRVTRLGTAVGTPQYMAPEQCVGSVVDARSDIYALGITSYEMLAGKLPFQAPTIHEVVLMQLNQQPPLLRKVRPELSAPLEQLIDRMLAKRPDDRFANAGELLDAVERIRRGAVQGMQRRPLLPESSGEVLTYDVELSLRASPAELWPHVSNTERLNRAAGLSAVAFAWHESAGGRELRGSLKQSGMSLTWRENPFEWVAPHRMGVLREYDDGPFLWLRNTVQLTVQGEGTLLRHRVEVAPRGVFGRAAAAMEVGFRLRRGLERVYQSIDAYALACKQLGGRAALTGAALDPFETPPELEPAQRMRLELGLTALKQRGVTKAVATALCQYLVLAPAQAVARIRPRSFARRYGLEPRAVLHACFYAVKEGLLSMLWNVLCPRCQVPAGIEQSLKAVREHEHCEACALDYGIDFGRSIEVVFAAHPSLRETEQQTYCIGGPAHRPHVVAQVRLAAGARFAFELALGEGNYQIAARELPNAWAFSVSADAPLSEWEVSLRRGLPAALPRTLAPGQQRVVLSNDYDHEIVARIERTNANVDAVTATEAACSSLFRELFPQEVLAPGLLISMDDVALLQLALHQPWEGQDETRVFAALTELVQLASEEANREGGAVVKIMGDGVLASFPDVVAAARAGMRLMLSTDGAKLRCAAVHGGSVMVTSINDRLDYFGRVVSDTDALAVAAQAGEIALSEAVQVMPEVGAMLQEHYAGAASRVVQVPGVVALAVSN